MIETKHLVVFHQGERLEGVIEFLSPSDITVLMVEPVPGLRGGSHIPYFAMGFARFSLDGQLTQYGAARAEGILVSLLGSASAPRVEAVRERPDALGYEAFRAERAVLRRQLRHEGLDVREYERRLRGLKARRSQQSD